MALDGYMYFEGQGRHVNRQEKHKTIGFVKGESPDERFREKHAFQIWYFKWDCRHENKGNNNRKDPAITVGSFRVKKEIDVATPTLFLANVTRSIFDGCHVYFRKSAGAKLATFFHAIFSEVMIEKWEINLDGEDTSEELTVNFNWCELNYYPQQHDGSRKKGDPAHTKQYCTSNPDSEDLPKVFRKKGGSEIQEGDLDLMK